MSGDWLGLADKTVLVCGAANKKSVAWHVGQRLQEAGAEVVWTVHTEARRTR
ncbi:MAG: enoyl-ACP reductase, partial [Planctomycetes bacterium]|nr:enoyl-ACP reductase [Planctomycetota bacterium]